MSSGALGREYKGGDVIVHQGEMGDCMYVIQEGEVEVVRVDKGSIIRLAVLGRGDFFGEMSVFEKEVRSATVRALDRVRVITVDKKTFMRRIQEDPTLAFRIFQTMASRIKQLNEELVAIKSEN
jgi:CRP/FNR family cyclic AMP-dependent transcriptional regulator